ncbi:MAG: S-layer homology domain-containing protein, partial [Oscillospiraceae bacterium]|nr:S-layer homology domain-containing protein [Oscillospiraceae bacterium]
MKTNSRALALFLCLMLLVGLLPSTVLAADEPEAASFEDVQEGSWYYEDVDYVSSAGLMAGTSEDTFSPELAVTRGMFVTVLHRMEDEPEAEAAAFEDVDAEAYYAAAVAWAAENGIVTGYSDVMFGPTDTITREQAVTILYRYAIYKGLDAVTTEENLGTFSDEADISDWAIAAVNWAVGEGIVEGMTSNRFEPATLTTRAHVATLLHRYLDEDTRVNSAADTGTGSSSSGSSSTSHSSGSHSSGGSSSGEDETGYYVFACDNETAITDDSLSAWFDADSAAEGVEALLNAGKVYVNGFQIPAEESDDIAFKVNGFVSFYKDDDEWMNSVHKATSGETTFAAARTAFVEGLSLMSGLTVVLPYDENGYVTEIQFTVKESVAVEELIDNGDGTYSIDRSNFTLAVKEGMPDINDAVFAAANVDAAV